jgi:transcriptional regulator with XRE-family HTH domain
VAEKLGKEQSYIARVESGKADIQLSSFFRIAAILGIQFVPTFCDANCDANRDNCLEN